MIAFVIVQRPAALLAALGTLGAGAVLHYLPKQAAAIHGRPRPLRIPKLWTYRSMRPDGMLAGALEIGIPIRSAERSRVARPPCHLDGTLHGRAYSSTVRAGDS